MSKPVKKKVSGCTVAIIAILLLTVIGIIIGIVFISKSFHKTEDASPKEGDTLSGISHQEIVDEYHEQKDISEAKANEYLASLSGENVEWIGLVTSIRDEWVGEQKYMVISLTEKLFDLDLAYANVGNNKEYQEIEDMTLIKISGEIDRVEFSVGVNVYFEEPIIDVVE